MNEQAREVWSPPNTGVVIEDGVTTSTLLRAVRHGRTGPVIGGSPLNTAPAIMPWPYSVDTNGQAFPAGIVALVYDLPDPDDPLWDGDWDNWVATQGTIVVAIPSSLPVGYTLNNDHGCRDRAGNGPMRVKNLGRWYQGGQRYNHNWGFPTYSLGTGSCNNFASDAEEPYHFPRVWFRAPGDEYLMQHKWGPMQVGNAGYNLVAVTPSAGADPTSTEVEVWSGPVAIYQGMRYSLLRYTITGKLANLRITVTRDSSWGVLAAPGGTTIADVSTGVITTGGPLDLDVGELLPDLGTFGNVWVSIKTTGDTLLGYSLSANYLSGGRCDIPITCTVAFRDWQGTDHVIPGGYVASLLTPPPFTVYTLTGSFSGFPATIAGDGKFIYVPFSGSPSSTYTLYSDGFYVAGIQFFQGDEAVGEPQSGFGPPGLGPWTFTTGADGMAWIIIDTQGDDGTLARFRVA